MQCVAVCCSVLQRVAVCCSSLQCVAVCCSALHCIAVCCSVLQCVAVCCSVLQCVAVCCSVLQCVAVHCSVLQCAAVCCSVLQCVEMIRHAVETREQKAHTSILKDQSDSEMKSCCILSHCVAACCSVLQFDGVESGKHVCYSVFTSILEDKSDSEMKLESDSRTGSIGPASRCLALCSHTFDETCAVCVRVCQYHICYVCVITRYSMCNTFECVCHNIDQPCISLPRSLLTNVSCVITHT